MKKETQTTLTVFSPIEIPGVVNLYSGYPASRPWRVDAAMHSRTPSILFGSFLSPPVPMHGGLLCITFLKKNSYLDNGLTDGHQTLYHDSQRSFVNVKVIGQRSRSPAGLSKFFDIPLVPGLVTINMCKSGWIIDKSRFN